MTTEITNVENPPAPVVVVTPPAADPAPIVAQEIVDKAVNNAVDHADEFSRINARMDKIDANLELLAAAQLATAQVAETAATLASENVVDDVTGDDQVDDGEVVEIAPPEAVEEIEEPIAKGAKSSRWV